MNGVEGGGGGKGGGEGGGGGDGWSREVDGCGINGEVEGRAIGALIRALWEDR
jgi:hypothetical protein